LLLLLLLLLLLMAHLSDVDVMQKGSKQNKSGKKKEFVGVARHDAFERV